MLLENLSLPAGAANGAPGTVECLEYKQTSLDICPIVHVVHVKLAATGSVIKVGLQSSRTWHYDAREYSKSTFPLQLGYAVTSHRSQVRCYTASQCNVSCRAHVQSHAMTHSRLTMHVHRTVSPYAGRHL